MEERRASSLLSLIAARAIVPGGGRPAGEALESKRQAEEQQMMYAVRMTYLAPGVADHGPDALFLTRKRAQKLALRQDSAAGLAAAAHAHAHTHSQSQPQLQLHPPARKPNASGAGGSGAGGPGAAAGAPATEAARKRSRSPGEDAAGCRSTWEPRFQAGCHFWQCLETGECRVDAPAAAQPRSGLRGRRGPGAADAGADADDDDNPPFPESFAFLAGSGPC